MYSAPDRVHLKDYGANPPFLEFSWNQIQSHCPYINYTTTTLNCGVCLPQTSHTSVLCTDVPINGAVCSFSVRANACGTIPGRESEPVIVRFNGKYNNSMLVFRAYYNNLTFNFI